MDGGSSVNCMFVRDRSVDGAGGVELYARPAASDIGDWEKA